MEARGKVYESYLSVAFYKPSLWTVGIYGPVHSVKLRVNFQNAIIYATERAPVLIKLWSTTIVEGQRSLEPWQDLDFLKFGFTIFV